MPISKGGSFKKKKSYFTQVSNNALRDPTLSLKSKGLYSLIQSYLTIEDENFILYKAKLRNLCPEGKIAFDGAWNELKDSGYLIQYKSRMLNGNYRYEYELLDIASL